MTSADLLQWLVPGLLTGCLTILGYACRCLLTRITALEADSGDCRLRTAELRAYVSEHFAKKAEVQHSLDRIHTRLDQLPRDIKDLIRGEK